ncbi:MAG TPA: ABC transporter permease, partial [Alphaproteobacteria bacterium]|nr:ABC transporter permease [Alphaproteobacteria bacterium]
MTDVVATSRPAFWQRFSRADLIFVVAIVALVIFAAIASDAFLTQRNLVNISRQLVTNGFLSLGMLIVIRTGGIDLSVGSVLAFAGLLATGLQEVMHFSLAIAVALAMGAAVGWVNGFLIARFSLQPFIVTLATMGSIRGLLYVYADTPRYPLDDAFRSLIGGAFIGPVPVNFILFALTLPMVWFYLNHTVSGRAAFAIGVNKEAVRLAGVNVGRHIIFAYVACGFLAAVAGVLLSSRLGIAQPSVGIGYELDAIAAVVIGGGILGGGGGTTLGVLGGV